MADSGSDRDVLLNELADDFATRYRRGERPALTEYISKHPELAEEIRDFFPAMVEMEVVKAAADSPATDPDIALPPLEHFGDFHILREIGRGGMGVVYEAEQISLGRRVALKLLTQRMLRDNVQKRRFEREAKAAARLHHTNIVPVFGSGEHDGTPYYVMQFIAGLGLDVVSEEVARLDGRPKTAVAADVSEVAQSLMTGEFVPSGEFDHSSGDHSRAIADTSGIAVSMTQPGSSASGSDRHSRKLSYWQGVARIGTQVADALEYAHRQGIIHRDVKPSNLLLDATGTAWVTDFGLAKGDDQENLTRTGDMLGTLRYMPPEAFDGKSDVRGDVYGLGISLYELLALRPAFDERDRHKLIKAVTTGEPQRLRRVRPTVPRDLETIVHKAIDREPSRRYRSAAELSADLQRFINDEPIRAREISSRERAWRWCRRNPIDAGLLACLVLMFLAGFAGVLWQWRAAALARDDANSRAQEAMLARDDSHKTRNASARQASGLLLDRGIEDARNGEPGRALHRFVRALQTLPINDAESAPLERVIRMNLAAWAETVPALEHIFPKDPHNRFFGFLNQMAFSPDSRTVGFYVADDEYQCFRTDTGRPVGPPAKLPGWIGRSVFAADGKSVWVETGIRIGMAAEAQTVYRIDPNTSRRIQPPIPTTGPLLSLEVTPDGRYLVGVVNGIHPKDTGPQPNAVGTRLWRTAAIVVWETANGQIARRVDVNAEDVYCVSGLSQDGTAMTAWVTRDSGNVEGIRFTLAGNEPPVRLGRFPTKRPHPNPQYQADTGWDGFAHFQNGMRTALVIQDGQIHRWSDARPEVLGPGTPAPFLSMNYAPTPDGRSIVSTRDGRIYDTGAWPPRPTGTFFAHPGLTEGWGLSFASMQYSGDGQFIASSVGVSGFDRRCWRLPRPHSRPALPVNENARVPIHRGWWDISVQFDPQLTHALLRTAFEDIRLINLATGERRTTVSQDPITICQIAWSPDGKYFATGGFDGTARVWELATGRPAGPSLQHKNQVATVAFSPDGKTLAAGDFGPSGQVKLWDWRTDKEIRPSLAHDDIVLHVTFSPDGRYLVTLKAMDWSEHAELVIWDLESGRAVTRIPHSEASNNTHYSIVFRPDSQALIARNANGVLSLLELPTFRIVGQRPLDGAGESRISPDGRMVAAGERRGVRLLDVETLAPLANGFLPHPDAVNTLAFSPDGAYLLTGRLDGSAQLWDVSTRKPIGPPAVLMGPIKGVTFTADSATCICVANDGMVRRWPVPSPLAEPDLNQLGERVALMTGQRMDDNQGLDYVPTTEWYALRMKLVGDGSTALTPPRPDGEWYDVRAADAEQDGDAFGAEWYLEKLAKLRPNDWIIAARRGRVFAAAGRRDEADQAYASARRLAPSPKSVADWLRVAAGVDLAAKHFEAARWNLDRAIELTPDDWALFAERAIVAYKAGQAHLGAADLDEMIRRGANDPATVDHVASFSGEAGDWQRASAALKSIMHHADLTHEYKYHLTLASLKAGDQATFREACKVVADSTLPIGPNLTRHDARRAATVFALHANATENWTRQIAWIDHAMAGLAAEGWKTTSLIALSRQIKNMYLNTRGRLLYRAGRYEDALKSLREAMTYHTDGGGFHDWVFVTLAEHHLGHGDNAKEAAAKARAKREKAKITSVWDRAEIELLTAELDVAFR